MKNFALVVVVLALFGCSTTKAQKADEAELVAPTVTAQRVETAEGAEPDEEAIGRTVNFEYNSSVLTADATEMLNRMAKRLRTEQNVEITIEGHTDDVGGDAFNLSLGEARARAVRNYLVKQGVKAERVSLISYGKERPFVDGTDDESRAQNRRGEVITK